MDENGGVSSKHLKSLENLFSKFEGYCKELVVFGFNSAGYDLKLIKKFLFKELCECCQEPIFTVKKARKYPCIKIEHLKFMDILQFLAPGYNLKSFFKAFGVSEKKVSFHMTTPHMLINWTKQLYHLSKLSTLPLKAVTSWKKNTLHSRTFSTKENLNKRPYKHSDCQQNQKLVLKIISGFNTYGLKIICQLLLIF